MTASRIILAVVLAAAAFLGIRVAEAQEQPRRRSSPTVAWVTRAVSAPRVSFHTFDSAATKCAVSYHLYTPAAYDRDKDRRFPVVYWLHGSGGGLSGIPSVARHFDAAIEAGKAPPCLVVFVNGLEMGMYTDWSDGSAPVESMIVQDLVAHVDATLRTIATREGRMLDGFSMGGYGAARLGFKHPEVFRAVSMMGSGPLQETLTSTPRASEMQAEDLLARVYGGSQENFRRESPRAFAAKNAERIATGSLVRMVIGDKDSIYPNNIEFHEALASLEIPHEWTVLKGVDHDPLATLKALGDDNWAFYRKAFGEVADAKAAANPSDTGKPAPAAEPSFGEIKLRVGDTDRRAIYANAPTDGTKRPAVIVLHGGMGSAEQMRTTSGFDAVARKEGFLVVYGHGTEFGEGRHAWNTGHLLRRQVRDADDIAYLDALIDAVVRDHGADPARISMTGGSNGGMMTFVYAVARPERLAAIAPVIASMFSFDEVPTVPLPALIINGAKDEEVPLEGGKSRNPLVGRAQSTPFKPVADVVDFWVKANKSKTPGITKVDGTVTTTTYAAGEGGATTEFVVDSVGGHGWPGTRSRRAASAAPIASFKGAERVWEFFKDKARVPAPSAPANPVSDGAGR